MSTRRAVAAGAAAIALLAGCTASPTPADSPTGSTSAGNEEVSPDEMAALVADAGLAPCPDAATDPAVGSAELAKFTLSCLGDGPEVNLAALGKPYVLVLWAGWCTPCAEEAEFIEDVYQDSGDAVGFLGINLSEPRDFGLHAAAEFGITFPSVRDDGAKTQPTLKFMGPPKTYYVDATGNVVGEHEGSGIRSDDELRADIRTYLGIDL